MSAKSAFVARMYQAGLAAGLTDPAARVMAAQAAIESAYGTRAPGNNFFAITKGKDWTGPTITRTDKDANGNPIKQQFRVYDSPEAGIADRIQFMRDKFPDFSQAPTMDAALTALQNGTSAQSMMWPGGFNAMLDPAQSAEAANLAVNGRDILYGNTHGIYMIGSGNADVLVGSSLADPIYGGAGNDILVGGGGADVLFGEAGADTFLYFAASDSSMSAADTLFGFTVGSDKIDLRSVRASGTDVFNIAYTGGGSFIFVDIGGNGTNDMLIQVAGATITASDILWTAGAGALEPVAKPMIETLPQADVFIWPTDLDLGPDASPMAFDAFDTDPMDAASMKGAYWTSSALTLPSDPDVVLIDPAFHPVLGQPSDWLL